MSLKSIFLTLPIKEQICLAIIFLHIFFLIAILLVYCSISYEYVIEDLKEKKLFYFTR